MLIKSTSPVIEGSNLPLACHVTGNPPPDVFWIRGSDNSVITRKNTILLLNIARADAGLFRCHAWNGIGKNASSNITVDVLCEYIGSGHVANHAKSWLGCMKWCDCRKDIGIRQ